MPANVIDAATIERLILSPPFHTWLGLRLVELGADHIVIAMPWRAEFVSDPTARYTHGGILATLIDLTADYAVAAKVGRGVPTIDMRVDYHKAALPGEELIGRGQVIKLGRTVATAEATVSKTDGTLIASGRGVYLTSAG